MSGAGTGKGLLARCISIIAFGREPHAVTSGANAEELEKRIAAELIEGGPVLFLDNLNNTAFRSNLLASAITERPARVRVLGRSQMVVLNASAFVILTGNGLSVSEDLARRFIAVDFDPGTEDPEARTFTTDIRVEVTERRTELLAALLTIWRWGRIAQGIAPGRALGSFEQWCAWVRDPLLALGCKDPADRVSEAKERDGRRQVIAELFCRLVGPASRPADRHPRSRRRGEAGDRSTRSWPPVSVGALRKACRDAHGRVRPDEAGPRRAVGGGNLCAREDRQAGRA